MCGGILCAYPSMKWEYKTWILDHNWLLQMVRTKQTVRGVVHGHGKPRATYPHQKPTRKQPAPKKKRGPIHEKGIPPAIWIAWENAALRKKHFEHHTARVLQATRRAHAVRSVTQVWNKSLKWNSLLPKHFQLADQSPTIFPTNSWAVEWG